MRKIHKLSPLKKKIVALKVYDQLVQGKELTEIAMTMRLPRTTLRDIISNDGYFQEYKKKKKFALDTLNMEIATKALTQARAKLKDAKAKDLAVISAIMQDKVYPPTPNLQQINMAGKDEDIVIHWAGWPGHPDTVMYRQKEDKFGHITHENPLEKFKEVKYAKPKRNSKK